MKTIRVYTDNVASDGYGAHFNGLQFFNSKDELIPLTDMVLASSDTVTFKLNGIPGKIVFIQPYPSSTYSIMNITKTGTEVSDGVLTYTKELFTITFESEVNNIRYVKLQNVYLVSNGWHMEVDGELLNEEGIIPTVNVPFRFDMPLTSVRCFVGIDGLYYFLRPDYNKADTTPSADPNDVPDANVI